MRSLTRIPVLMLVHLACWSSAFGQALPPSRPPAPPADQQAAPNHPGWLVDGRTGCWIWSGRPQQNETAAWSGQCDSYGRASGRGTLEWRYEGKAQRFEGDVRNGTPNGRGVETFADGRRYDGTFRDGQFNGRGVLTFPNGNRYEGDFRNGQANGRGVLTVPDGQRYEGEFHNDVFDGRGVLTLPNGNHYEGEFRSGTFDGQGVLTFPDGKRYEGEFRDNRANGRGVLVFADGGRYEGDFRDAKLNGRGVRTFPDGKRYDGEFRNGEFDGRGVLTLPDGQHYEGEFHNDLFHGHGLLTLPSGNRYEGEFRDGEFDGRGVLTFPNGKRYEGEFRDGQANGRGVETFSDGSRYDGEFRDGQPNGHGVRTFPNGTRYEGEFRDGQPTTRVAGGKSWMGTFVSYYRWISMMLGVICLSIAGLLLALAYGLWLVWLFCFPIQHARQRLGRTAKALVMRFRVIWVVSLGAGLIAIFLPYVLIGAALFVITTWLFFRLVPENDEQHVSHPASPAGILEILRTRLNSFRTMEPPLRLITGVAIAELAVSFILLVFYGRLGTPLTVAYSENQPVQVDMFVFWFAVVFLIVAWSFLLTGASHGGLSFLLVLAAFTYVTRSSLVPRSAVGLWMVVIGVIWAWGAATWWKNRQAHGVERFHWHSARLSFAFLAGWLTLYYLILYRNLKGTEPEAFYQLVNAHIFSSSVLLVPVLFLAGTDFAEMSQVISHSAGGALARLVSDDRQPKSRQRWSWAVAVIAAGAAAGILFGIRRWAIADLKEGSALVAVVLLALATWLALSGMLLLNRSIDRVSELPWSLRYPLGWLVALLSLVLGVWFVVLLGLLIGLGFFELGLAVALALGLAVLMRKPDSTAWRSAHVPFSALALAALFFTGTHEVATLLQASYARPFSGGSSITFKIWTGDVARQPFSVAYPSNWQVFPLTDSRTVGFAPNGSGTSSPLFLVTERDSPVPEPLAILRQLLPSLHGTVFARHGSREFSYGPADKEGRSSGGWTRSDVSLVTADQHTVLHVEVWVQTISNTTWMLAGVAPEQYRAYYHQLFTRMAESWQREGVAAAPEPWYEDLERTATRVGTFGLLPLILPAIGLVLLYRHQDKVRPWLRYVGVGSSGAPPGPAGIPRDMAGLFAVITGVTGFFFLPHGDLTELFGPMPIEPMRDPIAALQLVVAAVTIVVVLVVAIRRMSARYASVLIRLFELNLALLLIAGVYFLYGGFVGGSEPAALAEKTRWRAILEAIFMVVALLWDLFAAGTEITNVDGRVFRRPARVLLYTGYLMLVCTVVLFGSSQTFAQSHRQPERFFEAEEVVRQGIIWLASPLLLLSSLVAASESPTIRGEFMQLRTRVAIRLRSWFS